MRVAGLPALLVTAIFLTGCVSTDRISYDARIAVKAEVDGFDDIRIYADANRSLPKDDDWLPLPTGKELNYLVLSGGGAGGAFSVGVLKAWSDVGRRPQFDIVSGVSTGALIAPYAFLGRSYDKTLQKLYTSGIAEQLVDMKFLPSGLLGTSILNQEPLRALVEQYLTQNVLMEIAKEHRRGRRLLVLTSNLDSQRAVIWNMGAIANSGRPDALKLFQDVLIASASIPGLYPAVLIKAKFGADSFEEMHSDGGSASQILTIPEGWMANSDRGPWSRSVKFNMYILVNNALGPQFSTTKNNTFVVINRAFSTLIKAQTRSALIATYDYAQRTGIRFHVASIDDRVKYDPGDPFSTDYMRTIFNLGYAEMASGSLWKDKPYFTETRVATQR